jgi:hypothetical protein
MNEIYYKNLLTLFDEDTIKVRLGADRKLVESNLALVEAHARLDEAKILNSEASIQVEKHKAFVKGKTTGIDKKVLLQIFMRQLLETTEPVSVFPYINRRNPVR